jgi:subtilisin-like proprotein convertase family protein
VKKLSAIALIVAAAAPAMAQTTYGPGPGGTIPDATAGGVVTPITSDIVISDSYSITGASVTINGLTHSWAGDLIITLTKVGDGSATLVSRVGSTTPTGVGDSTNFGGTYTFANSGANLWTTVAGLGSTVNVPSGTYAATSALSSTPNNAFNVFNGQNSAGTWRLSISDNANIDTGTFTSWSITLVPAPGAVAAFGLAGLAGLRRRR